ncbi:hypothetical protein [Hymenobacter arizonensis]|uniref:DUF4932 domain-containing protein n=1 Tax=Hymenobacter arizonensis TaxID=1227077 RepID=A0A1I5X338_HYMAR|nr:hypothetical protein [Hymenobacter arizonensis]SFQ26334.1 hypothetical protein SAMN04515668_1621 [Hymenobacter arizonensis]
MKLFICLCLLLVSLPVFAQPAAPGPAVTVEVNRVFCLVRFVETLAGSSGGYVGSRKAFEKSRFNTPAARRWLRHYQNLNREPGFDFEGYPVGRLGSQGSTAPAYLAASADAQSLPDLQRRTVGLLPNEVLASLDSVYRFFTPAFDTLAWQPHAAELNKLRPAYAEFLAKSQLMQKFGRLRTFYGSVWPDEFSYRIQLNPQLNTSQGVGGLTFTNHAWVSGNTVLLDCHPASRNFVDGTAVVFHEMSHSLSAQQRLGLQQQLECWYLHNPSPNRRAAYNLMEEALATVAGEWIYAQQAGQPESGEWYNDDYINRYAKALYPLMTGYVERGQTIDSMFVSQAISAFDRTFPQAATDYANLFRKVLYWSNAEDFRAAILPFSDRFKSSFTYTSSPILNSAKALSQAQGGEFLPVILVAQKHEATLRYLRKNLPALRKQRLRPEKSFLLSTTGPNGPIILVNAHDPAQFTAAAVLLAKQSHLDPAHSLQWLK